jgi:hypothetical protein
MTGADLNGDGKVDLITANQNGTISVFMGNGDGTFQAERDYLITSASEQLYFVTAADFNHDGKTDLALCYQTQVIVLLGNGDGTFASPVFYSSGGSNPNSIAVGDFNADGNVDLAVVNLGPSTIGMLLGNGDGTFRPAVVSPTGFEPFYLAVGDFNHDGKLDIVTSSPNEEYVSVLIGHGDGSFGAPTNLPAGYTPESILAADFNGDGKMDFVVANDNDALTNSVSVFLSNGDGTFQPYVQYPVGDEPQFMAAGDLDGDGILDLIVVNIYYGGPSLSLLFGNGDGTFQPQVVLPITADWNVIPADFNNDGRLDLAIADRTNQKMSVLTQTPSVNLSPTSLSFPNQIVGTSSSPQTVTLTNASNAQLQIYSISLTGANGTAFTQTNTCPAALNAGANCSIGIVYSPRLVESDTATLTVMDSGAPSTQTVAISGNSVGPVVSLSHTSLSFGNQVVGTESASQTTVLANTGTIPLTISSLAANGNFSQSNTCGTSVAVSGSCTITVRFKPTLIGIRNGGVTIKDNAGPPTQII